MTTTELWLVPTPVRIDFKTRRSLDRAYDRLVKLGYAQSWAGVQPLTLRTNAPYATALSLVEELGVKATVTA